MPVELTQAGHAVKLVSTLCIASCIFFLSGHFVCELTSDAKSRAPIKALRNKATACLGTPPPKPCPLHLCEGN